MGTRHHSIILLTALLVMLNGCGINPESYTGNESNKTGSATVPQGRYAMRWKAYIGAYTGEEVVLKLAFVDVIDQPIQVPEPQLSGLTLLTEQGLLQASVDDVSPIASQPPYYPFIATIRLASLQLGTYSLKNIRYTTQRGSEQELNIGDWKIEILPVQQRDALKEVGFTVGGTRFASMEFSLQNTSDQSIVVEGLQFALPSVPVTTTMRSDGFAQSIGQSPRPNSAGFFPEVVETVQIEPGATATTIFFTFEPQSISSQYPFIQIQPLLRYRIASNQAVQLHRLPSHTYTLDVADARILSEYLRSLPSISFAPS